MNDEVAKCRPLYNFWHSLLVNAMCDQLIGNFVSIDVTFHIFQYKKAFQSKASRPLVNGYGVLVGFSSEQVWIGLGWRWSLVKMFGDPPMDRLTDRTENITFPQTTYAGGNNIVCYKQMYVLHVQNWNTAQSPEQYTSNIFLWEIWSNWWNQ